MKRVSDLEIDVGANDLLGLLKEFNPRDAGSVFTLAHFKLMAATYSPENKAAAIADVRNNAELVIELLNEGWQ